MMAAGFGRNETRGLQAESIRSSAAGSNAMDHHQLGNDGPAPSSQRRVVFVVDDEEMIRTVAKEMLRHLGYDVEVASSGEEGVERIQAGARPDCILLDVVMPGIGGAEALRRIHAIAPEVRVLISSGFTDRVSSASLSDEGATAIITKPYRMETLGL